ncbi:amino acid adenylation domain-containing protein [Nocardia sp. NPDC050175]|uniref:amino acid adenylation domain-containing protein n=1 Tax=Nocardia sp. NPDC050175 TaxID=3364317 RepID=UPI0037B90EE2
MSATDIIAELERAGIQLWEEDGRLRYRAPKGALTDARRANLRTHKVDVLAALHEQSVTPLLVPRADQWNEPFPLTDVQSAYLLGRHTVFGFGGVACQMYLELAIAELEPARLEQAWNRLIERHDMLRAVIDEDGSQRVLADVPTYRVEVVDLPDDATSVIEGIRADMGHSLRDPAVWPLFELRISRSVAGSTLHFSIDFLIADWSSIQLLLNELELLYRRPATELATIGAAFRDCVLAERALRDSARFERDRDWWNGRIEELPGAPELPILDDASTSSPPRFRRWTLGLSRAEWSALRQQAAARGVTASGAVLAAYAEVIGVWSRHQRFTLNLTLLNRPPLGPAVPQIVGDFTSVSMLAVDNERAATFGDRARELGAQLFEDMDHRLYSGVEVLREIARRRGRDAARMPIVFTSAIGLDEANGEGGEQEWAELGYGITQTPQVWIDCQAMTWHGELRLNWDVRDGVFADGVIDEMFASCGDLLRRLGANDETWDAAAPVVLPAAQVQRRRQLNDTSAPVPDHLLHEPVLAQANRTPERIAIRTSGQTMTYRHLVDRATATAGELLDRGCRPGELVAIAMDKGWEQVVAVLGVALAGAAWLPIDPHQPAMRREQMMQDADVRLVLTQSWLDQGPRDTISIDTLAPQRHSDLLQDRRAGPGDLAYVIFTSGSTGRPKGVMMTHRGAANTIDDINRRFGIGADDRVLALANLSFDLSVYDIFGPLALGGCVVIPDAPRRADPSHWAELVVNHGVTVWNSVPAQLQMLDHLLAAEPDIELPTLRIAFLSGDRIPLALPTQIRSHVPDLRLISLGGATEAGIWSIFHPIEDVSPGRRSIPYGKPLANQSFHVFGERWRHCPDLTTGELYIGGYGVASGYLGDPVKTAERFVRYPETGEMLYRTGDLGRYLPDGSIEFLGREDLQVKIRGYRIELGEVEAALQSHPAVGDVVVIVQGANESLHQLTGFVTNARADDPVDVAELMSHAADRLPQQMLPQHIHVIDAVPLTDNGKVDRRALSDTAPGLSNGLASAEDPPSTDLECRLAPLWAEVLGVAWIGRDQDFFRLGGDSLKAAKLVGKIREEIPEAAGLFFDSLMRQLLPTPTIAALATHLDGQRQQSPRSNPVPSSPLVPLGGSGTGPTWVLVHNGAGRLAPHRDLVAPLGASGAVVGFAVNETQSYLRWDPTLFMERRAAAYARLLDAHGDRSLHIVGCGLGWPLAVELARQLTENGVEVTGLTIHHGHSVPGATDPDLIDRLLAGELGDAWPEIDLIDEANVLRDVLRQTLDSAVAHRPSPYLGDLTWIRAIDGDTPDRAKPLSLGELRVVELPDGADLADLVLDAALVGRGAAS